MGETGGREVDIVVIYGLALLSSCMFAGILLGDILGRLMGIDSNVGGVGFAMIILIAVSDYMLKNNLLSLEAQRGITFWSAMYIPVVVAMSASQDVVAALDGGPVALLSGLLAVLAGFLLVPVISKIGKGSNTAN